MENVAVQTEVSPGRLGERVTIFLQVLTTTGGRGVGVWEGLEEHKSGSIPGQAGVRAAGEEAGLIP